MAIELAAEVAEKSQLKLINESRTSKLERLYETQVKIKEQESLLVTSTSATKRINAEIKALGEQAKKIVDELNAGQMTFSTTIEFAAPDDSSDDLGDIDLDNLKEDEAEAEALEPTEAEVEALQEGTGFYPEDEEPEVEEVQTEVEEEAPEGIEPQPATDEVA
jgi:hypothetical protein